WPDHDERRRRIATPGRHLDGGQATPAGSGAMGVGVWSVSSPAMALPSAALATRPPPERFATKQARSAASRTSSAVWPSSGYEAVPADASSRRARPRQPEPGPTVSATAAR